MNPTTTPDREDPRHYRRPPARHSERQPGSPAYYQWLNHIAGVKGCIRPIRLTGHLHTVHRDTGEILATRHTHQFPDGVLYLPCGDRRASVCPPCAETYRADTYHLIKAGLAGGKGIPDTVQQHPAVFATFTAPTFGPVHTRTVNPKTGKTRPCHIRRKPILCPHGRLLSCAQRHTENAPSLGHPLCPQCYDYSHHIMWNTWAGELWRRTMITLNRALTKISTQLDYPPGIKLRASYGKVAEYQRRGVVHFHAIIRIDLHDRDNPDTITPPPATITSELLGTLLAHIADTVHFDTPAYPGTDHTWPIHWGRQVDIRPITRPDQSGISGPLSAEAVAAYLAKYATKSTEPTGLPTVRRLTDEAAQHYADPDTHLGRLIGYCWELGDIPQALWDQHRDWLATHQPRTPQDDPADPSPLHLWKKTFGRLRRWAHMLGFGGHFATKSRRYSTTHKQLRAGRRAYKTTQRRNQHQRWDHHDGHNYDDDTTLIITDLTLAGVGYHTTADAQLAAQTAAQAREQWQTAKEERVTT